MFTDLLFLLEASAKDERLELDDSWTRLGSFDDVEASLELLVAKRYWLIKFETSTESSLR